MSQAHEDLATPRLAASIRRPKASLDDDSPIMRLPFETTLSIFRNCDPDIKSRLRLTHTCRSWMSITSQTASLWTSVQMVVGYPAEDERFDRLLLLLEMQLDRAAGMPLDVVWESVENSAFHPRLMSLLRRKGPFSRWRTLQLGFRIFPPEDENMFLPEDAFTNLESVLIIPSIFNRIITTLNRTTTSKLQVLEHRRTILRVYVTLEDCVDMIGHISCLTTDANDIPSLPNNDIHLEAASQSYHEFPRLQTYKLISCTF
jgi:hypothetical protein